MSLHAKRGGSNICADMLKLEAYGPLKNIGFPRWDHNRNKLIWTEKIGTTSSWCGLDPLTLRTWSQPAFHRLKSSYLYGGGEGLYGEGWVYFLDLVDLKLKRADPQSGLEEELAPLGPAADYALSYVCPHSGTVLGIRSFPDGRAEIFIHKKKSSELDTLVGDFDFIANPVLSPCGLFLAFIAWNHPDLPFESAGLYVYKQDLKGTWLFKERLNPLGSSSQSFAFAKVEPTIYWIDDRSGFDQIYQRSLAAGTEQKSLCLSRSLTDKQRPLWVAGLSQLEIAADHLIFLEHRDARVFLGRINLKTLSLSTPALPPEIEAVDAFALGPQGDLVLLGSSSKAPPSLWFQGVDSQWQILAEASSKEAEKTSRPGSFGPAEVLSIPTAHEQNIQAIYYPGHSKALVLLPHSGPTTAARLEWDLKRLILHKAGYHILLPLYRGSTGYGRDFRRSLYGQWGLYDAEDCAAAALYAQERLGIKAVGIWGSSAGGFSALRTLGLYPETLSCAIAQAPPTDLVHGHTHKFEAYYNDLLVAPRNTQGLQLRAARSPQSLITSLTKPLLIVQGGLDTVVPATETEAFVKALRTHNSEVHYIPFPEEGHSIKDPRNIEEYYRQVLRFFALYLTKE